MPLHADSVVCPTCRARQEWSDTCRRCRSDLRLLRGCARAYDESRIGCLLALRAGRVEDALRHARACLSLRSDAESLKLVAVCALAGGDWTTALAAGRARLRLDASSYEPTGCPEINDCNR